MKRAGNVLIIVGIVFAVISAITLVVGGILFLVFSNPVNREAIIQGLQDGTINTTFEGTLEEQAIQIQTLFQVLGIVFFIISAAYAVDILISSLAARGRSKALYLTTLVFNVIFFNVLLFLGAVFGLAGENEEI